MGLRGNIMSKNNAKEELVLTNNEVNKKRRSLTKASGAVPVLMMLGQRPAFGAVCTVSGYISATPGVASSQSHVVDSCGGLGLDSWRMPSSGAGDWTTTSADPGGDPLNPPSTEGKGERGKKGDADYGTTMTAFFDYSGLRKGKSLYDILWIDGNTEPKKALKYLVAAGLNASAGLYEGTGGLNLDEVKAMYREISMTGVYECVPGVIWSPEQLITFLKQTFD